MSTPTTDLVPTIDFDKLTETLKSGKDTDLASLLTELAKIPAPPAEKPPVKKVDPAVTEALNAEMVRSMDVLPKVFGKTALPVNRRELRNSELAGYLSEREEIAAAKKLLTKREELIKNAVSDHFDVVAEKAGVAKAGETPVDKNGHYLIGGSGKGQRQEARIPGSDTFFVREKSKDSVVPSFEKLFDLYEKGEVTREEFLSLTRSESYRVLDQTKIRAGLLSKARLERTQEILSKISVVKYGTPSINVRK